jgi:AhpD family alkylhydroperoxidase
LVIGSADQQEVHAMTLTDSMLVDLSAWPDGYRGTSAIDKEWHQAGVDAALLALVAYRVSQLERCTCCIDMYSKDALDLGDTQRDCSVSPPGMTPTSSPRTSALALADTMTALDRVALVTAVADASERFSTETVARLVYSVAAANA